MTPKFTVWALLCMAALQLNAQELEGFRGIEWGTSFDTPILFDQKPAEFTLVKTIDKHNYYTRANEDLTVGTAELELIYYVFNEYGHFCKVILEGQPKSFDTMLFILEHKYGETTTHEKTTELQYKEWTFEESSVRLYENANHDYSVHLKGPCQSKNFIEENTNVEDF